MKLRKTKAKPLKRQKSKERYIGPNESRRGFIRVDFDTGSKVGVGSTTGQTSFDALDLSVYGLSFLASPADAARFSIGTEIAELAFEVDGRHIRVRGRVAYLHSGLIAGLSKVAIEFTHIPIDDVWHLSRFVAEKAGVDRPGQIGSGLLELKQLLRRASQAKHKKRPKTKTKVKIKKKIQKRRSKS